MRDRQDQEGAAAPHGEVMDFGGMAQASDWLEEENKSLRGMNTGGQAAQSARLSA